MTRPAVPPAREKRVPDSIVNGCIVGLSAGWQHTWLCTACGDGSIRLSRSDAREAALTHRCA